MLLYTKNGITETCTDNLKNDVKKNEQFEFSDLNRFISAKKRRKNASMQLGASIYRRGIYV